MACGTLTTGRAADACVDGKAGLDELKHWLIDRSKITFGTVSATTGQIATMTVTGVGSALIPFAFYKKGFTYSESMQVNEDTGEIKHTPLLSGRFVGLSGLNRADVEKLKNTSLVSIVQAKNGKILVFGRTSGLTLTENEAASEGDAFGERVVLSSTDESEKYAELLITDTAATLSALVAAETPVA
jgi:hypothetical protein